MVLSGCVAQPPTPYIRLHKMGEADLLQSFLDMFKATAEETKWALWLLPLLSRGSDSGTELTTIRVVGQLQRHLPSMFLGFFLEDHWWFP